MLVVVTHMMLVVVTQVLSLEMPVVAYTDYTVEMLRELTTPVVKPLGYTCAALTPTLP